MFYPVWTDLAFWTSAAAQELPTIELARLTNGEVTGLDVDQDLLDRLAQKAEKAGLSDRVRTVKLSLWDLNFPEESFDIIWAEGSVTIARFRKASGSDGGF